MKPFCALECGRNSNRKRFTALPLHDSREELGYFLLRGRRGRAKAAGNVTLLDVLAAGGDGQDVKRWNALFPCRLAAVQKKSPLIFTFPWEKKKESTFSLQHVNCDSAHVENGDMPSIRVRRGYFTGRGDGIWVVGRMFQTPRQAAPACRELEDGSEGEARLRLVRGRGFTGRLRLPSASG